MHAQSAKRSAAWQLVAIVAGFALAAPVLAQQGSSAATSTAAAATGQTVFEPGDIHPDSSRVYVFSRMSSR